MTRFASVIVLLTGLLACGETIHLDIDGVLGHGEFRYVCGQRADANCHGRDEIFDDDDDSRGLQPLAVDAGFNLRWNDDSLVEVEPVVTDVVSQNETAFWFTGEGDVDFIAVTDDGEVVDFIGLTGRNAAGLAVFDAGREITRVDFDVFSFEIAAAPVSSTGEVLGGGFNYSWTSTGDVQLTAETDENKVTVDLPSDGVGQITVTAGPWSRTLNVSE